MKQEIIKMIDSLSDKELRYLHKLIRKLFRVRP